MELVNHYVRAMVVHNEVESRKNPGKFNTFANLKDYSTADGFDVEPTERAMTLGVPVETTTKSLDLDGLLD